MTASPTHLLLIGVAKAGTTSLFGYLDRHPDICGAVEKEPKYFSHRRFGEPLPPLQEYLDHFHGCGDARYWMEGTTGYFAGGEAVIAAIKEALERPRLVLLLRDPATRFVSYYNFQRSRSRVREPHLDAYLDACLRLRATGADRSRDNVGYWGLSGGVYADHLENWIDAFGDDLQVLFFEQLVRDAPSVVDRVCRWLDLPPMQHDTVEYGVRNATFQPRSHLLRRVELAGRDKLGAALRRWPRVNAAIGRAYATVNTRADGNERPSDALLRRLQEFYEPSNAEVATTLSRHGYTDLPAWLSGARVD